MPLSPRPSTLTAGLLAASLALAAGCAKPDSGTAADGSQIAPADSNAVSAADTAPSTGPGLAVGQRVGQATLLNSSGQTVTLASLYADRPVVVTFYRGGWCPYCNRALTEWETKRAELAALGVDFVAITPERPDLTIATAAKDNTDFTILSDSTFQAADTFRVRFSLDDATRTKYKGYGVDLEQTNAAGIWDLPAPGTFLIDTSGVVRYAFADWDYTKRANPDEVIAAARALRR